jgi:sugar phosphate isomerase/epimerase
MEYLLADHPELGVCCDVNHLFKEAPQQFIERLGSRIVTTHISDNDGTDEKHWLPGNGIIQWDAVIDALVRVGYRGPIMHEVRSPNSREITDNWMRLVSNEGNKQQ